MQRTLFQRLGLAAGVVLFVGCQLLPVPEGLSREGWVVVALLLLMATWWVSEAIPIPVTALLPLVVLPVWSVKPIAEAAVSYSNKTVILLMGGFIIAKSVEKWDLHRRIALNVVVRVGRRPEGLIAGFLAASALLSMWISNTATVIMLVPIAYSVAIASGYGGRKGAPFTVAILLAVAWGASIGGLGTPVGTPTNLIIIGYLESIGEGAISFGRWMSFGLPMVLILLPVAWFVLVWLGRFQQKGGPLSDPEIRRNTDPARLAPSTRNQTSQGGQPTAGPSDNDTAPEAGHLAVREALTALGRWTTPERRVLYVFLLVAFFWMFRSYFIQDLTIFGHTPFAGLTDHVIAIAGAVLVFLVPAGTAANKGQMLLDWESAKDIPWGVLLLFGGGLSLAGAITSTGLAGWLGGRFSMVAELPFILVMFTLVVFVIFATEITSNVATASALMPVMGAMALAGGIDPTLLAIPVAMAASCAFMLPVATGPNAIVFATGEVSIGRMAQLGLWLNLLACVVITGAASILVPLLLGLD